MKLISCLLLLFLIQAHSGKRAHKSKKTSGSKIIRIPLTLTSLKSSKTDSYSPRSKIIVEDDSDVNVATINIGNPPQSLKAAFQTGTNHVWFFSSAYDSCDRYASTMQKHRTYSPPANQMKPKAAFYKYSYGWVFGYMTDDVVTVSSTQVSMKLLHVTKATSKMVNLPYDGVFGLQYSASQPNLISLLCRKEGAAANIFSIHYPKSTSGVPSRDGKLLLCENDKNYYNEATLKYYDLMTPGIWRILVSRIEIQRSEGTTRLTWNTPITIDPSATFTLASEDEMSAIEKLTGAQTVAKSDIKEVNCTRYASGSLPVLNFIIQDQTYTISSKEYIREIYEGAVHRCQLLIKQTKSAHWTLGTPFIRKYYTVFDMDNHKIGFAESK